jgi:hypothetical protein
VRVLHVVGAFAGVFLAVYLAKNPADPRLYAVDGGGMVLGGLCGDIVGSLKDWLLGP